jgi:hypothetical protein
MKRFLLTCVALLAFTTTAFAYKVGDIIMVGGEMGIVYAVTSDGQHGKVMSVTRGEGSWEAAKQWCAQYGRGWRMPSKDELLVIYRKSDVLNPILRANGYTKLDNWCWSSTESNSDCAWRVHMSGGYTVDTNKSNRSKYFAYYVRAVSAF